MKDILRVCAFERDKFKRNKVIIAILVVLIIAIIVAPVIDFFAIAPTQTFIERDRDEVVSKYRAELEGYNQLIAENSGAMDIAELREIVDKRDRLQFFIDTNTIETDYLNADKLTAKYEGRERLSFMFYFGEIANFAVWALAILASSYLFAYEYHTGALKNILAARISRGKIFIAKALCLVVFLTAIYIILTLFALAFGLTQSHFQLYIIQNNKYIAISAMQVFATKALAGYVLTLVFSALSIISGIISKNIYIGVATPCVAYALSIVANVVIADSVATNPLFATVNMLDKMPLLSLQFHVGGFELEYLLSLICHVAFALAFMYLSSKIFQRQSL